MNTQAYKGIAPRTTPALQADRAARRLFGDDQVDAWDRDRVDYYQGLIQLAKRKRVPDDRTPEDMEFEPMFET